MEKKMNGDVKGNRARVDLDVEDSTCINCSKLCNCPDGCCLIPWSRKEKYTTKSGQCLCSGCHSTYVRDKKIIQIILTEQGLLDD